MGLAFHRLNNAGARPRTRVRNTEKKALASHSSGFTGDLTRLSMEVPIFARFLFQTACHCEGGNESSASSTVSGLRKDAI
jgi:hypothetical protein